MKLQEQVCSLELAKRLKELGVEQESLFYYLNIDGKNKYYIYNYISFPEEFEYEGDPISAFTVAELGQFLPECLPNEGDLMMWNYMEEGKRYFGVEYCGAGIESFKDETEANARAKMLIYLIENHRIIIE